ncbi:MAG: hypothetical protein NTX56_19755, partial [Proteobacteria bacterium]|nr:hypothetical protein [Pseudomonadota bacterium]
MKRIAAILACLVAFPAVAADVSLMVSEGRLVDLVRVAYGELSKEPYILGHEVLESQELFTVDLRNVSADRAVSSIADLVHSAGFEVRKRGGVVWIGKAQEPADELIVYRPKHRSARYLADVVQSVTAAKSILSRSIKPVETQTGQGMQPVPVQQSQTLKQSSPSSVEGQIDRSEVDQIA